MREISAHDLCATQLCKTKGCRGEAETRSVLCADCRQFAGVMLFKLLNRMPAEASEQ